MINEKEVDMMKEAYSLIYRIENSLRYIIIKEMKSFYGLNWYIKAPLVVKTKPYRKSFENLYFHELITFLNVYPCFKKYSLRKTSELLHYLISIRNKIAHNILLERNEYNLLCNYYKVIMPALLIAN